MFTGFGEDMKLESEQVKCAFEFDESTEIQYSTKPILLDLLDTVKFGTD